MSIREGHVKTRFGKGCAEKAEEEKRWGSF